MDLQRSSVQEVACLTVSKCHLIWPARELVEVKLFKNAFDDGFFSLAFLSIHSLSKLELKLTLIHYGQRQPSFSVVYGLIILLSD